jgi:hypothetical protein
VPGRSALQRIFSHKKAQKHKLILNGGAINYFVLFVSYPAGLWQGMQSFDPGTFPFNAGRAAIALS